MAPLPRWSDSVFWMVLLGAALIVAGVPALLMAWVRTPGQNEVGIEVEQPIDFDHRHHSRDDGIRCLYCHYEAETGPTAGVPDTALCMGCHNQIWNDSPQTAPIRESWDHQTPIRWRRVTRLPDFVFFDHSAHVSHGVGCETCHGRVDRMAAVHKVEAMHMSWCVDCHRDPSPHLRPPELVDTMGLASDPARGRRIERELDVAPPTHCTGCHR